MKNHNTCMNFYEKHCNFRLHTGRPYPAPTISVKNVCCIKNNNKSEGWLHLNQIKMIGFSVNHIYMGGLQCFNVILYWNRYTILFVLLVSPQQSFFCYAPSHNDNIFLQQTGVKIIYLKTMPNHSFS